MTKQEKSQQFFQGSKINQGWGVLTCLLLIFAVAALVNGDILYSSPILIVAVLLCTLLFFLSFNEEQQKRKMVKYCSFLPPCLITLLLLFPFAGPGTLLMVDGEPKGQFTTLAVPFCQDIKSLSRTRGVSFILSSAPSHNPLFDSLSVIFSFTCPPEKLRGLNNENVRKKLQNLGKAKLTFPFSGLRDQIANLLGLEAQDLVILELSFAK